MNILGIGLLVIQLQLATASGVVTKPGSNEPMAGATVILMPATVESLNRGAAQNPRIRFTVSEDDGRFTISDIEPGEYRLQVQSPLYGAAAYGQRRQDGPGATLTFASGQRLADLKIPIPPTGTIAGRVMGSSGEALAYATVHAMKLAYQEGRRMLSVAQTTTTDDRGEYRLFWLPTGKYLVVAGLPSGSINPTAATPPLRPGGTVISSDLPFRGPQGFPVLPAGPFTSGAQLEGTNLVKRILDDGTIREESWMPTYYPATADRALAAPVDVAAGATATGINITLGPSPVQKIRGRVTGGIQIAVTLAPSGQGTSGRIANTNASLSDGSFEFAGVVPGPYLLTAQDRAGLVAAPVAVLVADRDVENIALAVAPAVTLLARIKVEGIPQGALEPAYGFVGSLRPELEAPGRLMLKQPNALVGAGNTLTWENVPPGSYQLSIQQNVLRDNNLKQFHIKSIGFGSEDAFESFRVSPDKPSVLDVVLTTDTGSVEGVAIGRTGNPAANATVVLVPTNGRKRLGLYKSLVTGSDGKFRLQEIPPGDYKLFAWDDIETGAWQNAEFIGPFESRGRAVRVSESSKEEVQLNVIYNP